MTNAEKKELLQNVAVPLEVLVGSDSLYEIEAISPELREQLRHAVLWLRKTIQEGVCDT